MNSVGPVALIPSRRDLLRIGGLIPFGLSIPATSRARQSAGSARACILLWLDGGPSHLETFDLKPGAPPEVRGPFQPIATTCPGIQISELLPETAKVCEHLAILRSLTSPLGEHGLANRYLLTGNPPTPVLDYPSFGSVMARVRPTGTALPAYVAIPEPRGAGAGFLGADFEPFSTAGDPARPDFRVRDLDLYPGIDDERLARRREFLNVFESRGTRSGSGAEQTHASEEAFDRAAKLLTARSLRDAFRLDLEPNTVRARYGSRTFGQSCLLARRLVEQGVPFVTVVNPGWDTHDGLVLHLRDGYSGARQGVGLVPTFDLGFAALIADLSERGLLESTLVIAMGEFGRTPKLNPRGGRDHWPRVFSAVLAGGGIRGGQIVGASDRMGESPLDQPVTPADLALTIYRALGIDPALELTTPDGRPIPLIREGRPVPGLLSARPM